MSRYWLAVGSCTVLGVAATGLSLADNVRRAGAGIESWHCQEYVIKTYNPFALPTVESGGNRQRLSILIDRTIPERFLPSDTVAFTDKVKAQYTSFNTGLGDPEAKAFAFVSNVLPECRALLPETFSVNGMDEDTYLNYATDLLTSRMGQDPGRYYTSYNGITIPPNQQLQNALTGTIIEEVANTKNEHFNSVIRSMALGVGTGTIVPLAVLSKLISGFLNRGK